MDKGKFYGVAVGPGDPELMTLKAVRVLNECEVVAAPETKGEKTLALDIASGAVDLSGKELVTLQFLMTKDPQKLEENHRLQAEKIMRCLEEGKSVAMLNLGDVSIYSTFSYLLEQIKQAGYETQVIPGVPSFCAVAALLQQSLTVMNKPLHIIPAGHEGLEESLDLPGTKVLMKTGKAMPLVRRALKERGLYEKASLVQNCGLPEQHICRSLDEADDSIGYFTTIVVKD
ncbi:precorrin-2 C(20)-methyltransferase [Acidaminobacterium chupaoyuni]